MTTLHVVGVVLWRGGLLLVGGYVAFAVLRVILSITDIQLEIAVAILLAGLLLVFLSVLGERIVDAREERSDPR